MQGLYTGYNIIHSDEWRNERQIALFQSWSKNNNALIYRSFDEKEADLVNKRPKFLELLAYCKEKDTIVIASMEGVFKTMDVFCNVLEVLKDKKVDLVLIEEGVHFKFNTTDIHESLLTEFCLKGIKLSLKLENCFKLFKFRHEAREQRKYGKRRGNKFKMTGDKIAKIMDMRDRGYSQYRIAKDMRVSRTTVIKYLKMAEENETSKS